MPRVLNAGAKVRGYTITEHLNTGAMALAYAAKTPSGEKVFLKSYKSPTCAVEWYKGYLAYQKMLKQRIEDTKVGKFCVRHLDQFEETIGIPTYFQVFEFVTAGEDLGKILERLRRHPSEMSWNQRLILAKVMAAAVHQLHEAKVVHGDLKPPNLQLFKDTSITAGWQLKLIDMDFSILTDEQPPWHGKAPYVGTPNYFSLEHLAGDVPIPASDVFTCGLILYELLANGHPYLAGDDASYLDAAKRHAAAPPRLQGVVGGDDSTKALVQCLHRCLHPNHRERPSARNLNLALNGKPIMVELAPAHSAKSAAPAHLAAPTAVPKPGSPAVPIPPPTKAGIGRVRLEASNGAKLDVGVATHVGSRLLRLSGFGAESSFADGNCQFRLEPRNGEWFVIPAAGTENATLLNGNSVDVPTALRQGDVIALGSRKSAKKVLDVRVELM